MSKSRKISRALALLSRVSKRAELDMRIDGRQLLGRRLQLGAAHVLRGVQHLALQVGVIHHVEIDHAEGSHAGCGQVKRQRRAESARPDAEHARGLKLLLAGHADLGHDQVARVAQDFVVAQGKR